MTVLLWCLGVIGGAVLMYRAAWWLQFPTLALMVDLWVLTPLLCSRLVPVPLLPWIYRALGARIGEGTHVVGVLCDPPLTTIGARCLIGSDALLTAHAIDEVDTFVYAPIVIGDEVLIGSKAVVMAGTRIGHGARIAAGAVVTKGAIVPDGETWAGVPARRIA